MTDHFSAVRDPLARLMFEAGLAESPDADALTFAADAILADFPRLAALLGYVQADGEEWAVEGADPEAWMQTAMIDNREDAEVVAGHYRSGKLYPRDPDACVIRRQVGPWEVA